MSRVAGCSPAPAFENGPNRGVRPLSGRLHAPAKRAFSESRARTRACGVGFRSSRRKIFQIRQPAIDVIAAFHRLLPGMRSRRGRRSTPSASSAHLPTRCRPDGERALARQSRADREHQVVAVIRSKVIRNRRHDRRAVARSEGTATRAKEMQAKGKDRRR